MLMEQEKNDKVARSDSTDDAYYTLPSIWPASTYYFVASNRSINGLN